MVPANKPDILLMDEPFSSLDAQTASEMHALLWSIRQKHPTTIIFVTHNIDEAITVCDRIAIFSRRPASLKKVLLVKLSVPRSLNAANAAAWATLRTHISSLI